MAGADTLASLGQKVTDLFVGAFGNRSPDAALVFLPFALPVPNDIVQTGTQGAQVNPTQMASFLGFNFDAPYLMSPSQYTIHGKDLSYGAASQIYTTAVTLARPNAAVDSDSWKRVTAEIAMAQSVLDPGGIAITCEPDDWVMPDNNGYWSAFDSSQTQTVASSSGSPVRSPITIPPPHAVNPALWMIKPAAAREQPVPSLVYLHAVYPAATAPAAVRPAIAVPPAAAARPAAQPPARVISGRPMSPPLAAAHPAQGPLIWRRPIPPGPPPPPPPQPPPSTSSMTAHFEYMAVTIGFMAAGRSTWDGVFLADHEWCIPGMGKGVLLPSPDVAAPSSTTPLAYGLPTALIVVRNLKISVKWTGQEQAVHSGDYLGPFSLANASATTAADGSSTYSTPGMQVVALLCSHLPALPPVDPPDAAAAAPATSDSSSTAAVTSASADTLPASNAAAAGAATTNNSSTAAVTSEPAATQTAGAATSESSSASAGAATPAPLDPAATQPNGSAGPAGAAPETGVS